VGQVKNLCPNLEDVFKAYELTQPDNVKVCILGLDPYINGEAHGLSFSSQKEKIPPSLRIIFKELFESGILPNKRTNPNLEDWAAQGVLLLNTVLTTERGKTLAHGAWGWEQFTGETLKYLAESENPVVFLAWGKNAQKSIEQYVVPNIRNQMRKLLLFSYHPAAELYGGSAKFTGNGHFVKANEFLETQKLAPICW
jgi:uracil-DNA glycosylase